MKVTCEREKLLHAFQTAASVVPTRSPKPILQNIKLEALPDRVTLMATDLELGIRLEVLGFEVITPGSVVLPVSRCLAILRESADEKLHIESDGRSTLVQGQRAEFRLPSENPDEFPTVTEFDDPQYHEISARFFREIVRRTVYATDQDSSRYALGGVLIELGDDTVTAIGTDGRRLAKQEGPARAIAGHQTGPMTTIIPTRAMTLLDRALADNEDDIQLAVHSNDVRVRSGRAMIYTRLVEGRYPRWRDVFPHEGDATVKIDIAVGPFHATVRQAAIVSSEERRGVDFTFGEGKVVLACRGAELGESRVELPLAYDGPPKFATLDPRYVSDFLKVLNPEQTFQWEIQDSDNPVVCSTDDGYSYVIMPLSH